jgi:glucose/arabinose dehydrogenase
MTTLVRTIGKFGAGVIISVGLGVLILSRITGDTATLPVSAGTGPRPQLPSPHPTLLPTVKIARVVRWRNGETPVPAPGLSVSAFATGLNHPRWLYVLPDGDVLVAETDGPQFAADATGVKGHVTRIVMKLAGAGVTSPNRITLLRPTAAGAQRFSFLQNLRSPFGMVLVGNDFYVANTDSLMRYPYTPGETSITAYGEKLTDLPGGPIDHHWTKNVVASADGTKLYVSVGSNSNVGENGLLVEENRAAILEIDRATGSARVFASGLRNPVGMAWEPHTGALWTAVNERDELGSDLVPDYMTHVQDGGFYGWPWSYYGQMVDARLDPPRPDMVEKAIVPDYALGPHTASLGLCFSHAGPLLPPAFAEGAFVGQHGSWNRNPLSGYKVIFVPFKDGKPDGMPVDVLTGFLTAKNEAHGRPVGVTLDKDGALLVADDVGGVVWRVVARK